MSYSFPRYALRPAIWHGVPQNRTFLPSSRYFSASLKLSPISLWTYFDRLSSSRSPMFSMHLCFTLNSSSNAAPNTTPPSSSVFAASSEKTPPEELFPLTASLFDRQAKALFPLKAPDGDETVGDDTVGDETVGDDTIGDDTVSSGTASAASPSLLTNTGTPFPPAVKTDEPSVSVTILRVFSKAVLTGHVLLHRPQSLHRSSFILG